MSIRFRFMLFFLVGVSVTLIPLCSFFYTGVIVKPESLEMRDVFLGVGLAALMVVISTIVFVRFVQNVTRPLTVILEAIREISMGNLSPAFPETAPAELGLIGNALSEMCQKMRVMIDQLGTLSKRVSKSTGEAGESFDQVQEGIRLQSSVADRTFDAVGKTSAGLTATSRDIEEMAARIESSASKVAQMDKAIGQVAGAIGGLNQIIEKASRATGENNKNVQLLSRDIASLTTQIYTASSALSAMAGGARKAQADATDTALLMENLTGETKRIEDAIEATLEGSDAIHRSNERILSVTESLQSRVDRVDDVLEAVHGLAERTKLLSINASIIASEAGEHGRAFAVVAREVKELAQSTATAIAEISVVLEGLKQGFNQTVITIQSGQTDVEKGILMSRNAVVMLRTIPGKVQQATALSTEIAATNAKQVEEGTQVQRIVERVVTTLKEVANILKDQVDGNEHTLELFDAIRQTSKQVLRSTSDHAQASSEVNQTVEDISGDFRSLAERLRDNTSGLDTIEALSEEVLDITDKNRRRIDDLVALMTDLNRYAIDLDQGSKKLGKTR